MRKKSYFMIDILCQIEIQLVIIFKMFKIPEFLFKFQVIQVFFA